MSLMKRLRILFPGCPLEQALIQKTSDAKEMSAGLADMAEEATTLFRTHDRRKEEDETCPGERRLNHLRAVQ